MRSRERGNYHVWRTVHRWNKTRSDHVWRTTMTATDAAPWPAVTSAEQSRQRRTHLTDHWSAVDWLSPAIKQKLRSDNGDFPFRKITDAASPHWKCWHICKTMSRMLVVFAKCTGMDNAHKVVMLSLPVSSWVLPHFSESYNNRAIMQHSQNHTGISSDNCTWEPRVQICFQ